jgi:steroid 5-alpha reductase family enzyme
LQEKESDTKMCGHKECHMPLLCLESYVGIISTVHIHWKQSTKAHDKRLEFMAEMWRDTHAILLALVYCLQGQVQIMDV